MKGRCKPMNVNMKNVQWKADDFQKDLKRRKFRRKFHTYGYAIRKSIVYSITDAFNLGVSTMVGLTQGLKYTGNWKRGLKAGLVTLGVITVVTTISTVGKVTRMYDEKKLKEE